MNNYRGLVNNIAKECLECINPNITLNRSMQEKAQRIRECVGMIMDVAPIMPVGQEHPAKKEADKKRKKEKSEK